MLRDQGWKTLGVCVCVAGGGYMVKLSEVEENAPRFVDLKLLFLLGVDVFAGSGSDP